jgi:hypothetical protein
MTRNSSALDFERAVFNSAATGRRLEDSMALRFGGRNFEGFSNAPTLQNFQHVLRTGTIIENSFGSQAQHAVPYNFQNMRMDLNSNDSFARSVQQTRDAVLDRVENDPEMQRLMQQRHWGRTERVQYEMQLSRFVEEEMSRIPGLRDYRSSVDISINDPYSGRPQRTARSSTNLNDLSFDIDNNTMSIRWDCSRQSAVQGAIMQMVENTILPTTASPDNMHVRSNYFRAVGLFEFHEGMPVQPGMNAGSMHAWVVSSATGNVIEATADPSDAKTSYQESADPNFSFYRFARGDALVTANGAIYTASANRQELADIRSNEFRRRFDFERFFESIPDSLSGRTAADPSRLSPEAQALIIDKRSVVQLNQQAAEMADADPSLARAAITFRDEFRNNMIETLRRMEPTQLRDVVDEIGRERRRINLENDPLRWLLGDPDRSPVQQRPDMPMPDHSQQAPSFFGPR